MTALFDRLSQRIMADLMRDVPQWTELDAAAAVGNAGHESGGFRLLQEVKPVVKNSRGGWGWFQWTAKRRVAFEKWATERGLAFDSYEANYGFFLHELRGSEKRTIEAVRNAPGLADKTIAFELAFERAGVKHYPSRIKWAERALAVWRGQKAPANPKPLAKSRTVSGAGTAGAGGAIVAVDAARQAADEMQRAEGHLSAGTILGLVIGLVILIGAGMALYARWDDAGRPLPKWVRRWA